MSHIFDAFQRSEAERAGTDSQSSTAVTDLLRRAEKATASGWEQTTDGGQDKEDALRVALGLSQATQRRVPSAQDSVASKSRAEQEDNSIFRQSQRLQVSVLSQNRLVCLTDLHSPAAEAFRLLGVRCRDLAHKTHLQKLLITSTIPDEGKSVVAANLACILASKASQKVLLIEGDLRAASMRDLFGIGDVFGLTEWHKGERSLFECVHYLEGPGCWILPAGTSPANPLEILQSGKLPPLLDQLATLFDWIIIDSPPVLPLADTSIWMRLTDGILLVARRGTTEKKHLLKGIEALDQRKLIGTVLNCSQSMPPEGYYYRYQVKQAK